MSLRLLAAYAFSSEPAFSQQMLLLATAGSPSEYATERRHQSVHRAATVEAGWAPNPRRLTSRIYLRVFGAEHASIGGRTHDLCNSQIFTTGKSVKALKNYRRSFEMIASSGVGLLAILWLASGPVARAVPLEPDDIVGVGQSGAATNRQHGVAIEKPTAGSPLLLSTDTLADDYLAPALAGPVDIAGQGDHQLIADYHELLFQISLAAGMRPSQSLADLPAALEAAIGLAVSPTGATVFTGQAYEDFRNKDPDIVEEDPATESYSIVSDSDAIAGGADVAAGELATTAHAAESTDWRLSAISLDPVAAVRTGFSEASPNASNLVRSPQGSAAGSAAGPAAEPSTLALLLATLTAIVISVQAIRQSLKECD